MRGCRCLFILLPTLLSPPSVRARALNIRLTDREICVFAQYSYTGDDPFAQCRSRSVPMTRSISNGTKIKLLRQCTLINICSSPDVDFFPTIAFSPGSLSADDEMVCIFAAKSFGTNLRRQKGNFVTLPRIVSTANLHILSSTTTATQVNSLHKTSPSIAFFTCSSHFTPRSSALRNLIIHATIIITSKWTCAKSRLV